MTPYQTKYLIVFAIALAANTASHAQEFCPALTNVANETSKSFKKFRNGDDGTGGYRSSVSLPGASDNCEWQLSFSDDPDTQAKTFIDGIKGCYPAGTTSGGRASKSGTYYFHRLNGVEFYVKSDPKGQRVRISIAQDK